MRDKQAFEAYVLEKSKIEKNKIAMRRKAILTAGTALCACLVVLMVLPGILEQPPMTDGTNNAPEALPMHSPMPDTPMPTTENAVGGTEDEGTVDATEEPAQKPTTTNDKDYSNGSVQQALPLDEAFAQKKSNYAIPDRINEMTEVATIRQICDWVMMGTFTEGIQPEGSGCTMTIYYGQDTIVCYFAEAGFFKMGEGPWLKTDPAYVKELMNLLKGD